MTYMILHPLMPLMYITCAIGMALIATSTGVIGNRYDD